MKSLFIYVCLMCIGVCLSYVINGKSVRIEEYPFYVNLRVPGGVGGGSILNKRWILTAAHAVDMEKENIHVFVGTDIQGKGEHHEIAKIFKHPAFNAATQENDIALILLKEPLSYSDRVKRIHLPPKDGRYDDSDKAMVVGLGLTKSMQLARTLQAARLPTLSKEKCEEGLISTDRIYKRESMICAINVAEQRDSAQGDSGGPLFVQISGKFIVIGVVAFGPKYERDKVHVEGPGYYTRVSRYIDWINETVIKNDKIK